MSENYLEMHQRQTRWALELKRQRIQQFSRTPKLDINRERQKAEAQDAPFTIPNRNTRRRNIKAAGGRSLDKTTLPRELVRALESGDVDRVEACINKALDDGWTEDELEKKIEDL